MVSHRTAPPGIDFYETPPGTAWHGALIASDHAWNECTYIDAGAGNGVLGRTLEGMCTDGPVRSFDLQPTSSGIDQLDLMHSPDADAWFKANLPGGSIFIALSNPPYTIWREFVGELVKRCDVVIALGPISLLDTRLKLPRGLTTVHMTARPRFSNALHQHPMPHAWMVFSALHKDRGVTPNLIMLPDTRRDAIKLLNAPAKK